MPHHLRHSTLVLGLVSALAITQLRAAQVFPITVDSVIESGCEAAFDGSNYLVGVRGGPLAEGPITAQLVSPTGTIVRSGISPGESGGMPRLAFDGTNYLMVWAGADATPGFRGQFVSKSGDLVRPVLRIGSGRPATGTTATSVAYGGGRYLACWSDSTNLRGQLVNPDGTFFGPSFIVSGSVQEPRENAIAFDGTNFFVVFNGGAGNLPSIYGRFVSPQGGLNGGPEPVLLDSSPDPSDNPLAVCFDGTGYLVVFNDEVGGDDSGAWHIFGRLVSTSGVVSSTRLALTANTGAQRFPFLACDGSNYLMAWGDGADPTGVNVVLRFFDRAGQPVGPEFLPFTPQGANRPLFGAPLFDGTRYLVTAVLVGFTSDQDIASADVYGTFVSSILPPPLPFKYTTNNGMITITGYTGPGGVVSIPDTLDGLPVTSIGWWAFADCTNQTSVTIPASVTSIESWAFADCTGLTDITIPNSVTSIGRQAFDSCTGLTGIAIPDSVTSIGEDAFYRCTSLTSIGVDGLNTAFSSLEGVLFNKSQTTLITCPGGKAGSYTIPHSVTSIWWRAFARCTGLTNITIPNSVRSIGYLAFSGSGQPEISTGLRALALNGEIMITGSDCSRDVVAISAFISGLPVTSIGDEAFSDCSSLTSVTIPSSVTSIGYLAFHGCTNLIDVTIPDGVTSIGDHAFSDCSSLTNVTIGRSVTSIRRHAFAGCSGLTSITIPNGVTEIENGAFVVCSGLTNITIPNSVTSIRDLAFSGCTSLTSLTIPNGVTNVGGRAFSGCTGLTGVYFQGNAPDVNGAFYEAPATVYYLPGSMGWGATFDGRPTALWTPMAQARDSRFGVRTNQFGFNLNWASGRVVVVEAATDLTNPTWSPVSTNTLTDGSSYFSDPQWTNSPARFYRLRSP